MPGDQVATRGNAFTRGMALLFMRLTGWRVQGAFPNVPKFVLVVAPHTSNWDFPVGIMAMYALGIRGSFLGKEAMFRWPMGGVVRWLGGIPVDRSAAHNVVFEATALFRRVERLIYIISPEGTRKKRAKWRTGFYHVARSANVPIVAIAFDWSRREFRIFPSLTASDDQDADFRTLQAYFHAGMARHPDQY
jgi:1-acyl-sn-glycerol-3-phosphate acyltransferase